MGCSKMARSTQDLDGYKGSLKTPEKCLKRPKIKGKFAYCHLRPGISVMALLVLWKALFKKG